jgi:hypothetical protein
MDGFLVWLFVSARRTGSKPTKLTPEERAARRAGWLKSKALAPKQIELLKVHSWCCLPFSATLSLAKRLGCVLRACNVCGSVLRLIGAAPVACPLSLRMPSLIFCVVWLDLLLLQQRAAAQSAAAERNDKGPPLWFFTARSLLSRGGVLSVRAPCVRSRSGCDGR